MFVRQQIMIVLLLIADDCDHIVCGTSISTYPLLNINPSL